MSIERGRVTKKMGMSIRSIRSFFPFNLIHHKTKSFITLHKLYTMDVRQNFHKKNYFDFGFEPNKVAKNKIANAITIPTWMSV